MTLPRTLLTLVELPDDELSALERDAKVAEFELHRAQNLRSAVVFLATRPPDAVLVDLALEGAEALCLEVRSKRRASDVPVFGLTRKPTDTEFVNAFSWGMDDVISLHCEGALSARLVALPADRSIPPSVRGDALLADSDTTRANLIGRTLSNAGYQVRYVSDRHSLRALSANQRLELIVASLDLGFARQLITTARDQGADATWIVTCHPGDQQALRRSVEGLERVGVVSVFDPVNDILYVSNELAGDEGSHGRLERRLPYGTLVAFRSPGSEEDEFGFTYNVSAHGLYVRTLAPPVEDRVWLEVCPPGSPRRVRLEGEVMWRRSFGRLGTATAPPGFGVRVVAGLGADHRLWIEGLDALKREADAEGTYTARHKLEASARRPRRRRPSDRPQAAARAIADDVERSAATPAAAREAAPPEDRATPVSALELVESTNALSRTARVPRVDLQTQAREHGPAAARAAPADSGQARAATFGTAAAQSPPCPVPVQVAAQLPPRPVRARTTTAEWPPSSGAARTAAAQPPPLSVRAQTAAAQPPPSSGADQTAAEQPPPSSGAHQAAAAQPPPLPVRAQTAAAQPPPSSGADQAAAAQPPPLPVRAQAAAAQPPPSSGADQTAAAQSPASSAPAQTAAEQTLRAPEITNHTAVAASAHAPGEMGRPGFVEAQARARPPPPRHRAGRWLLAGTLLGGGLLTLLAVGITAAYLYAPGLSDRPEPPKQVPAKALSARPETIRSSPPAGAKPDATAGSGIAASVARPAKGVEAAAPPSSAAPLASAVTEPGGDGSELEWSHGYLVVKSSADATVYATAVRAGPTNRKLKVRCGLRWVRLGSEPGPVWISPGKTVNVACQSVTHVEIEPTARSAP